MNVTVSSSPPGPRPTRPWSSSGLNCFQRTNCWRGLLRFHRADTSSSQPLQSSQLQLSQRRDRGVNITVKNCYSCSHTCLTCWLNLLLLQGLCVHLFFRSCYVLRLWSMFECNILLNLTPTACSFFCCCWKMAADSQQNQQFTSEPSSEQLCGLCQLKGSQPPQAMSSSIYPQARDKWHHCGEEIVKIQSCAIWGFCH